MIKQTIQKTQIEAMKAKDTFKVQALRYILAQIQDKEIDLRRQLSEDETIKVLRNEAKKLNESISAFKNAGRTDLQTESQKQLDILNVYLPKELSDDVLIDKIKEVIAQNKEIFERNPNAFIGLCIGKLKSIADSSRIAALVKAQQTK